MDADFHKELFQEILDNNLDGVIYYEAIRDEKDVIIDFKYCFLNDICFKVLTGTREEYLNNTYKSFHPHDPFGFLPSFSTVIETGEPSEGELFLESAAKWYCYDIKKFKEGVLVFFRDITTKKQLEVHLQKSLHEKDMIIKESHHRIKNNLQLLQSILHLQAAKEDNVKVKTVIDEILGRLNVINLIHDKLFTVDSYENIDLPAYILGLVTIVCAISGVDQKRISINTDMDDIKCSPNFANNIGLFINELVTNSLKYAFPNNHDGIIEISIKKFNDTIRINVSDNGIGFNKEITDKQNSLGIQLLYSVAEQLEGELKFDISNGSKITLIVRKEFC